MPASSGDPLPLTVASATVCGTAIDVLVRPNTYDATIVAEVAQTYQFKDLVARYRREPSVTVFDIGAHIGTFSVMIARLLPRAVVHAFEAAPENFEVLCANVRHAGLEGRIHPTHAAIGAKAGFFVTDDVSRSPDQQNTGGHSVTGITVHAAPPADGLSYAPVMPLGALLERHAHVDILKIDCEGSEFDILYNLGDTHLARVGTMLGEIHSCEGFVGTRTNGNDWNAVALQRFLGQQFDTISTSHRVETDTAVLEAFHATRRPMKNGALHLLRRWMART